MRRPQGYATVTLDGVVTEEIDTYTCGHCNAVVPVAPGQTDTHSCLKCDRHICPGCARTLVLTLKCVPFEKQLEAAETRDRLLRQIG